MNQLALTQKHTKPNKRQQELLNELIRPNPETNHPHHKKSSKSKKRSSSNSTKNQNKTKGTPAKKNKESPAAVKKHLSPHLEAFRREPPTTSLSQDKTRPKQFVRKNNNNNDTKRSKSKRTSKKSTGDQNEQSLVEHLRAENDFYRKAYLESKQSLQKLERALEEEKNRRSSQKNWFKHQIDTLKRKLSAGKIKLGHIFTFESFKQEDVSSMILEVENESSSMVRNTIMRQQDTSDNLSDLSIESK